VDFEDDEVFIAEEGLDSCESIVPAPKSLMIGGVDWHHVHGRQARWSGNTILQVVLLARDTQQLHHVWRGYDWHASKPSAGEGTFLKIIWNSSRKVSHVAVRRLDA